MPNYINKVGMRFGKLKVLKLAGVNKSGNAVFICECDCGKKDLFASVLLRNDKDKKHVDSCGCTKSPRNYAISQAAKRRYYS